MNEMLLKSVLVRKGLTAKTIYESIGMPMSTWNYKVNRGGEFTQSEISAISKVAGLTREEIMSIFFPENVEKTQLTEA